MSSSPQASPDTPPEADVSPDRPQRPFVGSSEWRWLTRVILVLLVLLPAVLLAARWQDPTRGQLPFGWQMHTTCWGAEDLDACG